MPVAPAPQPAVQQHTFELGFAVPAAPAPAAQQQHLQANAIVGANSLNLSSWQTMAFEKTPHLLDDSEGEDATPPPPPLPKKKKSQDPYVEAIRNAVVSLNTPRIYHSNSRNLQQTAPSPASAAAQDHEMTVDSPPQNGGNGNIGNLFTQAARQHVNLFGQSGATSTQPSLFAAPPMASSAPPPTFAATPVAFSAPAPSFSAPAASSPASSLFFPAPSTAASASAAPFSFSPAPVPAAPSVFSAPSVPASAPPALFSASSALFSALQKETPASAVASAASSVAAPVSTPPTPQPAAVPASLAAPASPVSAPLFPVVTPASPTVNSAPPAATPALPKATLVSQGTGLSSDVALIATPSNAGLFSHMLPAYSLRALEPQQYPSIFSEKQRYQFRMAFKLMSLEAGLQNHLDNHPGEELDSDRTDVYNKVQAMILDEAARVIPSTRKRTSDDNGQMNGYLGETKRQEISNHSYIPTKPANPPVNPLVNPAVNRPIDPLPATPLSSGNKKRKADEQITKDSYDPNGSVTIHETAKKGRSSTDEGVSYPKLPSPKSSNTPSRASNTAQLFQNLTSSVSAKEAPKPRSMGSSSSFQNKANTSVTSSQEDSLAATNTENTPAAAKNQSQFKVPTFAASSGQKPSFHFGTTSTNTTDKPTGSVPNFGESASDASQKAAFQVSNFGALSSSAKDKSAGPVPKSSESAGDVSQKPTFQVPKFGNPTNFLDAFSKKAATDEKKEKAKRKAKEFDSDEDDEENWERQDAEKQAAKKQKMAELVKDEFKFKMPTAPASGQKTAPPLFSISGSTVKSPTKSASVEKTVDTPAAGRSLFDRIENDTNGEPKREMPLSGETNSRSATTPSAQNIFGASTKAPSNIFGTFTGAPSNTSGASTSGPSKFSDVASSAPSNQKTPEKKRLGGFGTPNANPEAAKLFSALSGSPNAGDNTWKPETPIKFGASQAAPTPAMSSKQGSVLDSAVAANPFAEFDQKPTPAINITAATPTPATSSKQTSVFDSATKSKSFTGFGQDIFGSTPTTSSTTPSSKFGVGFNFGAPPTSTTPTTNPAIFNLAPSNNASAATSRGTTPDTGNATDEEALQDEQIDLASASKGEESEEIIFDCRARIQELNAETKKYETRAVGPLRLLKHKESGKCRLVGRIDASGRVVLNAGLMPSIKYEKVSKQVKFGALNLQGKLSTWVVLFKEAEKAEEFAKTCEENKSQ